MGAVRIRVQTADTNDSKHIYNSIQDYFYSAFYNTIVAKQLHREFRSFSIQVSLYSAFQRHKFSFSLEESTLWTGLEVTIKS